MSVNEKIIIGLRNSQLSKAQTESFLEKIMEDDAISSDEIIELKFVKTKGDIFNKHRLDKIGGKGLFVSEIEDKLINKEIQLAVHSMKDLPSQPRDGLLIGCWLERLEPNDAFISNSNKKLMDLPSGSVIGTSSIRRRSQVLNLRKDLKIKMLRGNVDTRIKKLENNEYDAIILSFAGLKRLRLESKVTEKLSLEHFLPAGCQGAVGIQARLVNNFKTLFNRINHTETSILCSAERSFLKYINANCNSPVSVYAVFNNNQFVIHAILYDHDGSKLFEDKMIDKRESYLTLPDMLGDKLIKKVGLKKIQQLDNLKDDFNYTP